MKTTLLINPIINNETVWDKGIVPTRYLNQLIAHCDMKYWLGDAIEVPVGSTSDNSIMPEKSELTHFTTIRNRNIVTELEYVNHFSHSNMIKPKKRKKKSSVCRSQGKSNFNRRRTHHRIQLPPTSLIFSVKSSLYKANVISFLLHRCHEIILLLSFYSFMGSFTLFTTINQYAIGGKLVARHSHIFLISSHYYSLQDKIIFANKLRKASVMLNLKVEIYVLSINRSKFMRIVRIFIFLSLYEA